MNTTLQLINNKLSKILITSVRNKPRLKLPAPGTKCLWRKVHYPEEYTIQPLKTTNLAGRDPETGRVVHIGIGGGIKKKYHWIDIVRTGPKDNQPPLEEKVLEIFKGGCRSGFVALVGCKDKLKYIIATENMKPGDIIKTSCYIPRIPVRANEGDAYPLGALPIGTKVMSVEKFPGTGGFYARGAGTFVTIMKKENDKVVIQLPSKQQISLEQECMAVVGRTSNVGHQDEHIGSAQNLRYMGYRPRSGLWHRKEGRHGRKIRPLPPVKIIEKKQNKQEILTLNKLQ